MFIYDYSILSFILKYFLLNQIVNSPPLIKPPYFFSQKETLLPYAWIVLQHKIRTG